MKAILIINTLRAAWSRRGGANRLMKSLEMLERMTMRPIHLTFQNAQSDAGWRMRQINDIIMPIGIGCAIGAIILMMGILIVKFALS